MIKRDGRSLSYSDWLLRRHLLSWEAVKWTGHKSTSLELGKTSESIIIAVLKAVMDNRFAGSLVQRLHVILPVFPDGICNTLQEFYLVWLGLPVLERDIGTDEKCGD